MPYAGKQLMQRDLTQAIAEASQDIEFAEIWAQRKVELTATFIGESHQYVGAWHDNTTQLTKLRLGQVVLNVETYEPFTCVDPTRGKMRNSRGEVDTYPATTVWITSRDCGPCQNNIPASQIGTEAEFKLRTTSSVYEDYWPVVKNSMAAAYDKWSTPWVFPDGTHATRELQPWAAWYTGWAPYPEWYVWHHDPITGQPVDPKKFPNSWVASGRYLQQGIRAVGNWWIYYQHRDPQWALGEAKKLAGWYKVTKGTLAYNTLKGIYWNPPPPPTFVPESIEVAATFYPKPNDGQSYLSKLARAGLKP